MRPIDELRLLQEIENTPRPPELIMTWVENGMTTFAPKVRDYLEAIGADIPNEPIKLDAYHSIMEEHGLSSPGERSTVDFTTDFNNGITV